jgi:hypothetical protein
MAGLFPTAYFDEHLAYRTCQRRNPHHSPVVALARGTCHNGAKAGFRLLKHVGGTVGVVHAMNITKLKITSSIFSLYFKRLHCRSVNCGCRSKSRGRHRCNRMERKQEPYHSRGKQILSLWQPEMHTATMVTGNYRCLGGRFSVRIENSAPPPRTFSPITHLSFVGLSCLDRQAGPCEF